MLQVKQFVKKKGNNVIKKPRKWRHSKLVGKIVFAALVDWKLDSFESKRLNGNAWINKVFSMINENNFWIIFLLKTILVFICITWSSLFSLSMFQKKSSKMPKLTNRANHIFTHIYEPNFTSFVASQTVHVEARAKLCINSFLCCILKWFSIYKSKCFPNVCDN